MDIFSLLDDTESSLTEEDITAFFNAPEPQKDSTGAKRNTSKKEKSVKADKVSKTKNATDYSVRLPVTIRARGFRIHMEGIGEKKISDILSELDEMGYNEVRIDAMDAAYESRTDTIYICSGKCQASGLMELVDFENGDYTILDGMTKFVADATLYPDLDPDEISVDMLMSSFTNVNPMYLGAVPCACGNIVYPLFTVPLAANAELEPSASVFYDGELHSIGTDTPTAEALLKSIYGNLSSCSARLSANADKTVYFVSFISNGQHAAKKFDAASKKSEKRQVVQKYALPLTVYIATFNASFSLSSTDFPGKERVSLDDVVDYFKPSYKIFSDTSRKLDAIYIKEANTLSLMFVSGKKGAAIPAEFCEERVSSGPYLLLRTLKELKEALCLPIFHGNLINRDIGSIRVENLPHGIFLGVTDSRTGQIVSVSFSRKLPKIPKEILNKVLAYFREDLTTEQWVKVCYSTSSHEYFIVKGTGNASKDQIHYSIPEEINTPAIIHVMEIHSHNCMAAFFSEIDDRDEIYPGVFGVVGCLNKPVPQLLFRAGLEGTFVSLNVNDLFDFGG